MATQQIFSDNFDYGAPGSTWWWPNSTNWPYSSNARVNNDFYGRYNSLMFTGSGTRQATTKGFDTRAGGNISFDFTYGNSRNGGENVDSGENVVLEYNTGYGWRTLTTLDLNTNRSWNQRSFALNQDAQSANTQFRWRQIRHSNNSNDEWAIDNVSINVNAGSTYSIDTISDANEGGKATFRIYRSGNTSTSGSVRFYTGDGSAKAGYDYRGHGYDFQSKNQSVTFAAGETYKDITVQTNSDNQNEGTENFRGYLSKINSADSISTSSDYAYIYDGKKDTGDAAFKISGTPAVGQTLTAQKTASDPDGDGTFSHTWKSNGNTIGTGTTLTVAKAQEGQQIHLSTTYSDGQGFAENVQAQSVSIGVIDDGNAAFKISGTPAVGQTLTAQKTASDPDGDGTFSHTWKSNSNTIGTGSTLTVAKAQEGQQIHLSTTYTDKQGFAENVQDQSVSIGVIDDGNASFKISGSPAIGQTLTAQKTASDPDGDGTFTHTWKQNNAGQWADIGKGASLILRDAQEGKQIRAISTYTDKQGFAESVVTTTVQVASRPLVMAREGLFDGKTVTLEFNRELDNTLVGKSRFQAKAGRRKMRVQGVNVNGTEGTIDIKLDRDVTYYDDLLINYKDLLGDQASGVVQDVNGNDLKSLSAFKVSNSYAGPAEGQGEPLELIGAEYADGQVELELNDEITNHRLNKRRFKVWSGKYRMKVTNAEVVDDAFVTLDVAARNGRVITEDTAMQLSYSDMRGDQSKGVIEDLAGYDLDSFKKMEVDVLA